MTIGGDGGAAGCGAGWSGSMVTHRATEYGKPRTGVSIAPESAAAARRQHSHHIVVIVSRYPAPL